jgi:hypothetical protein
MSKKYRKSYQTWYRKDAQCLIRWNDIATKEFNRLKKENLLIHVGFSTVYQKPYMLEGNKIYRILRNKKVYEKEIDLSNNIVVDLK